MQEAGGLTGPGTMGGWCGDPVSRECWTCPESGALDFPDPIRTLSVWRAMPFCSRCTGSGCLCTGESGTLSCPSDFHAMWGVRDGL